VHIVGSLVARAERAPMSEVIEALAVSTVDLDAVEYRAATERQRAPISGATLRAAVKHRNRVSPKRRFPAS
jgi:hypothetical protein